MMGQQGCSGDRASSPGSVSAGLLSYQDKDISGNPDCGNEAKYDSDY